jgi:hypothetical protein
MICIVLCPAPQSSAHSPRHVPGWLIFNHETLS